MNLSPQHYAAAFLRTENRSPARLFSAIARRGDLRRAGQIVREIILRLVRERGGHFYTLETARLPRQNPMKTSPSDYVENVLSPALVAGVRITRDREQELDMSFARILTQLYA